jgi:hypothetical protein
MLTNCIPQDDNAGLRHGVISGGATVTADHLGVAGAAYRSAPLSTVSNSCLKAVCKLVESC